MSRTLSKLFVKISFIVYAVNFAVLFIAMMLLLSATNNMNIYMIPGIFFCGIICLVYPDFFNVVAGAFGMETVTSPTPTVAFDHIKQIVDDAMTRDYSFLKQNGLPLATFCVIVCWIAGIFCICQLPKLDKIVNSPMDWYKRKFLSTYVYGVFGLFYGVVLCLGACAVIFAKEPLTGGLMTFAWYFLICGLAIVAGVVILILERIVSVHVFDSMTVEEQTALCEKQSKYMNKRQRRRQVRRLGSNARTSGELEKRNKRKAKNKKGKKPTGKPTDTKPTGKPTITTIEPVKPTDTPAQTEQPQVAVDEVVLPTDGDQQN
ncbi:MAG: hypothetical protein IJX23_02470 [Clostridia bacterium]|nr:hypothetical protein [Clostridia bacterium]